VKRRRFITLVGGTAAWPLAARAQQRERMRRIGVLMNLGADDAEGQARLAAFLQGLQEAGWAVGRNIRIDIRWGGGDPDRVRRYTAELVALAPDVRGRPAAIKERLQTLRAQPRIRCLPRLMEKSPPTCQCRHQLGTKLVINLTDPIRLIISRQGVTSSYVGL
jgi:hypothetical protein